MIIIPAIDLKDGKVVQLKQGNPNNKILELNNPIEVAKRFIDEGAEYLHIVDLNGAFGEGDNLKIIENIVKSVDVPVEVGGGIRSINKAKKLIDLGVDRIIIGTRGITDREFLKSLSYEIGKDKIVLAVESKNNKIVIKGWREEINKTPIEVIKEVKDLVGYILFTNVDVEGLMKGVNIDIVKEIVEKSPLPIIYSGGVSSLNDIKNLNSIGVYGVIIGSALYKGLINLKDALEVIRV